MLIGSYAFYAFFTPLNEEDQELQTFVVEEGWSGSQVAQALEDQELIASALVLKIFLKTKEEIVFHKGEHQLSPSMPAVKIVELLQEQGAQAEQVTITIPEGFVVVQIGKKVAHSFPIDQKRFDQFARNQGEQMGEPFPKDLEGYLFPETYAFMTDATEADICRRMTQEFRSRVLPLWEKYQGKNGLDLHQTVVLASLIEREAQVASERPRIAGVYLNRLKLGMKMECDATVQYALGKQKEVLLYRDLEIDSPYNTYLYPGLPPGPIASPGLSALEGAMNPEHHDYLYYVRNDVKGDGSHVFTKSYREHEQAIDQYLK